MSRKQRIAHTEIIKIQSLLSVLSQIHTNNKQPMNSKHAASVSLLSDYVNKILTQQSH